MESLTFPITKADGHDILNRSKINRNAKFPSRLRELRAQKKISQEELRKALGVSKSTISLYEQGDTIPDVKNAVALAEYFQVSCDYLLCQSDDPYRQPSAVDELGLTPETIKKIKADNKENKKIHISLSSFINHAVEGKDTDGINYIDRMEGIIRWAVIHGTATINSEKKYEDLMEENANLVMKVYNYNAVPIPVNDAINTMIELVVNTFRDLLKHYFTESLAKTIGMGGKGRGKKE